MAPFSPKYPRRGFTSTELMVVLFIVMVLYFLGGLHTHCGGTGLVKGQLIQAVSNARQIHLAAMSMATDGGASSDPGLAWPGDLKAGGRIATVADYVNLLVSREYLRGNDLKVFSAAGLPKYPENAAASGSNAALKPPFEEKYNAFKVFLVKEKDPSETVFLATKNYTYNTPLDPKAKPFGEIGFVVCRYSGDAHYYRNTEAQNLKLIGPLPGGGAVESAENCLNPGPASR